MSELEESAGEQQDELWLMSYADLLTLLVGFFVLLLAASPIKLSRLEKIAASISGEETQAPLVELKERLDEMIERAQLEDRVLTREDAEGLGIEFKDALLFDSGSAEIRPEAGRVVAEVARLVKELPGRAIIIEGHTDDVPIRTAAFQSNWELGSKRAINVLLALEGSGIPRARMSVRSYAETRALPGDGPVEQRRAANRRVVIRVE